MITLFYAPGACSLAPHIVLEWIGAPYKAVKTAIGSPELLALNPAGAVPAISEEDGWHLTQASAILDYITQLHPEADLAGGSSPREKAEAHKWSAFLTSDVHASFWPIFMPDRYSTDAEKKAQDQVVEAGKIMAAKKFTILNAHMEGRDWILGEGRGKPSYLDAYAFPMLRWGASKLPEGLKPWPNLLELTKRLYADPAVDRVLAVEATA
ncbi:glutathione S-transferase N-terminal domain-containing protein [Paracoccus cavernae]|uniref:Glutathione S-transferase N-terminal domain-containing protein n=1 Tax=Paracoccus cavernae TaxID=1571207 RepID=A0ABT8D828_9RHOB|nr:glutathione S-transferase N-terminal domain-containing protein [Paracoccus cavernae]